MSSDMRNDDWAWVEDDSPGWVPPSIDTSRPSVARMYDFLLGGKDNFAADREAADQLLGVVPDAGAGARANRAFMVRTVQQMAEAGIDQFLDLGTGIPTSPNVHETARGVQPGAAVVYVDNDPIVLAHNRALLVEDPRVITLQHDLREPTAVLDDPQVKALIDFDRPIGLLLIAVLHFVELGAAPAIVSRYVRDLPAGSRVAITALCRDGADPTVTKTAERAYADSPAALVARTRAQIEQLFDGARLMAPGVHEVYVGNDGGILGGVAVK